MEALHLLFLLKLMLLLLLLRLVVDPWRSLLGSCLLLVLLGLKCLGVGGTPIIECLVQCSGLREVDAERILASSRARLDSFLSHGDFTRLGEPLLLACDDHFVVEAV